MMNLSITTQSTGECQDVCFSDNATIALFPIYEVMSATQYEMFNEAITVMCIIVATCGIVLNTLNIQTFVGIGAKDGVTASLLYLSVTDLFSVIAVLVQFIGSTFVLIEKRYGYHFSLDPFAFFFFAGNISFVSSYVNILNVTFITVARCMCVTMPLHFRNTFTRKRCNFVLVFLTISVWAMHLPIFANMGMRPTFDPRLNATRVMLWMSADRGRIKDIIRIIITYPIMIPCLLIDVICVMIFASKLRESAKFRRRNAENADKEENISNKLTGKDFQVVLQILLVSLILIFCNIFKLIAVLMTLVEPTFDMGQPLQYLYLANSIFITLFDALNSTVNFFVYFYFNSKFRSYTKTKFKSVCGSEK